MSERLEWEWGERAVGDVVAEDYRRASVFKVFGIDFCCGGDRTVRAACEKVGADYEAVAQALSGVAAEPEAEPDPGSLDLDELVDHIIDVHHAYVRASMPVLRDFSTKVARVHGGRHPELNEIRDLVGELATELMRHMDLEEAVLFPRIAALDTVDLDGVHGGVRDVTQPLEDDHDRAGELVRRLRSLSDGFTPPEDACATYRATYAKLAEFEEDLHRHVHLENNVLFPRAAAMEEALAHPSGLA
jgi:regulator of cell morphogenesis and NO signaling